jgi:hypothetical protein
MNLDTPRPLLCSIPSHSLNRNAPMLLNYYCGLNKFCLDLGKGYWLVACSLAIKFERVLGVDHSVGKIAQVHTPTPASTYPNVDLSTFAEYLPFASDEAAD